LDELKNSCRVILTPNHNEFKRLYQKVLDKKLDQNAEITQDQVKELSTKLGGVNVFCKGNNDIITNGTDGSFQF
jgi:NAD(P)H-hydrate repair Nnr-like enzyme with NAD(P)H-hydrate dehydratase domain